MRMASARSGRELNTNVTSRVPSASHPSPLRNICERPTVVISRVSSTWLSIASFDHSSNLATASRIDARAGSSAIIAYRGVELPKRFCTAIAMIPGLSAKAMNDMPRLLSAIWP